MHGDVWTQVSWKWKRCVYFYYWELVSGTWLNPVVRKEFHPTRPLTKRNFDCDTWVRVVVLTSLSTAFPGQKVAAQVLVNPCAVLVSASQVTIDRARDTRATRERFPNCSSDCPPVALAFACKLRHDCRWFAYKRECQDVMPSDSDADFACEALKSWECSRRTQMYVDCHLNLRFATQDQNYISNCKLLVFRS